MQILQRLPLCKDKTQFDKVGEAEDVHIPSRTFLIVLFLSHRNIFLYCVRMKRRVVSMDLAVPCSDEFLVERNNEPLGVSLINPYAVGKQDRSDIVALAEEISKADSMVQATTCSKLQIIAEQMRFLQEQARKVLSDAKENIDLNHAACNFRKIPGNIYYLYRRESGQVYFSMLSPKDWSYQGDPPHKYLGAYYLKEDMTWIAEEKLRSSSFRLNDITAFATLNFRQQQIGSLSERMDCQ